MRPVLEPRLHDELAGTQVPVGSEPLGEAGVESVAPRLEPVERHGPPALGLLQGELACGDEVGGLEQRKLEAVPDPAPVGEGATELLDGARVVHRHAVHGEPPLRRRRQGTRR